MAARKKKLPPEDRAPDEDGALLPPSELSLEEDDGFQTADDDETAVTVNRNRSRLAEGIELNPASLVGSYFHRYEAGKIVWSGKVIGEVQAGNYLCQVDTGLTSGVKPQVILPIEEMLVWQGVVYFRFYDTQEAMQAAFAEYDLRREE